MAVSITAFTKAFNATAGADKGLTKSQKEQLDKLKDIADAISAEGTFKAELSDWMKAAPGLKITRTADGQSAHFRVGFGFEAFSGSATIALTSSVARTPVGQEGGYALQFDGDKFLSMLGEAVAERLKDAKTADEALKYVQSKSARKA